MKDQRPLLNLVAVDGEGKSVDELVQDALGELAAVATKHLSHLAGSGDPALRYLASVQANATALSGQSPARRVRRA